LKIIVITSFIFLLLSSCGYHLATQQTSINVEVITNSKHPLINALKKNLDTKNIATLQLHILKIQQFKQSITTNNLGQVTSLHLVLKADIKITSIQKNTLLFNGTLQQSQVIDISNNSSIDDVKIATTLEQLQELLIQQILFKINNES
jgi:hypothetical protein